MQYAFLIITSLITESISFRCKTPGYRYSNPLKSVEQDIPEGFTIANNIDGSRTLNSTSHTSNSELPIRVFDVDKLKSLIKDGYRVQDMDVRGDCFCDISNTVLHPVPKALYARKNANSQPGNRDDGRKIALAIEGGGMRGCVAGGMVTAVWHLGLQDTIDVVYGSSAGSLVGAYFISRQLPYFGTEIYYDVLTSAGQDFIDAQAILRACGLGLFDLRADSLIKLFTDRMGKPVINLDYLLDTIVQSTKPLDWTTFWAQQISKNQTLKVVASGLLSKRSVAMSAEASNFKSIEDLTNCMKASMLLPGVSGDTVRLKVHIYTYSHTALSAYMLVNIH
jgi:hypothetical protein